MVLFITLKHQLHNVYVDGSDPFNANFSSRLKVRGDQGSRYVDHSLFMSWRTCCGENLEKSYEQNSFGTRRRWEVKNNEQTNGRKLVLLVCFVQFTFSVFEHLLVHRPTYSNCVCAHQSSEISVLIIEWYLSNDERWSLRKEVKHIRTNLKRDKIFTRHDQCDDWEMNERCLFNPIADDDQIQDEFSLLRVENDIHHFDRLSRSQSFILSSNVHMCPRFFSSLLLHARSNL